MFGPVTERSTIAERSDLATAALQVTGSVPVWDKYFYGLQIAIPGLCVMCVSVTASLYPWDE